MTVFSKLSAAALVLIIVPGLLFAEQISYQDRTQTLQTRETSLENDGSAEAVKPIPSGTVPIPQVLQSASASLSFPGELAGKKFELSNHESIFFTQDQIDAKANGSTLTLNLRDMKLTSVTFIGYVLGPFYPDRDYLKAYFPTLEALAKMIEVVRVSEKQNPENDRALSEAQEILSRFKKQAWQVKEKSEQEFEKSQILQTVENYYDGKQPAGQTLAIEREPQSKDEIFWNATQIFPKQEGQDKIQNRLFVIRQTGDDFDLLEVQDRNEKNGVVVREKFRYDRHRHLTHHTLESYFLNRQVKMKSITVYDQGVKTNRYFYQFDESGTRIRYLNETFDQEGNLKASSDYRYGSGKRYFQKYTNEGAPVVSGATAIPL